MNERLKALMFGMGLIAAMSASDEVCNATLAGWFGARGMQRPDDDEKTIKILASANGTTEDGTSHGGGKTTPLPLVQSTIGTISSDGIADNVRAARDRELAEAREEAAKAAVARADTIRAGAQRLQQTGLQISDEQITAAINDRSLQTAEQAIGSLVAAATTGGGSQRQPNNERGVGRIVGVQAEQDRFYPAAIAGLELRCDASASAENLPQGAIELSRLSMSEIVARDLSYRGISVAGMDREAAASLWLQQGGQMFFSGDRFAAESSISSAGDFPNLLSGWSRKMLDRALTLANTTYQRWCSQHASVGDLHPRLIMGTGPMGLLEDIADDEKTPQDQINEEALAWFKAQRKSKKVPLTAVMVAQDDLNAFTQQLQALRTSQELTLEHMAVELLVANGDMLDGNALFSAAHSNVVAAAGGAPDNPQATAMRLLLQRQTVIGDRHIANLTPDLILVPPALEDDAKRTYLPMVQFGEQKAPITDATLSTARGTVRDVVTIPLLETLGGATGLQMWYVFANPAIAPVVKYVFMRGYENGRTDTWFDPDRQTRYFRLETRAAVFANHYRGGARNVGV